MSRNKETTVDDLVFDAANVRTHNDKNKKAIRNSVKQFKAGRSILVDADNVIRAGNGTAEAWQETGGKVRIIETDGSELIAVKRTDLKGAEAMAYAIADNRASELAEWDSGILAEQLKELDGDFDIESFGFDSDDLSELMPAEEKEGLTDADDIPEVPKDPVTKNGDLWIMGDHRLLCGDSTKEDDVARLINGAKASMVHADPPYGMGKEKDGVLNDNLYGEKLDAFQMAWWQTFRPHLENNASGYVWGNAADLWRLWYCGGLAESERLTFRNEIVWSKGSAGAGGISHIGADGLRLFPQETERCLFFMLGEQGFNNNADNYWEGWEPIRAYLDGERKRSGLTTDQCNKICGKQNMTQSAFTKGGFRLILREDYEKLRDATNRNAFKREYDELKREYDELKREFYETRAHFDNTHDNMTDVWKFKRVTGEARHGHATPKPVEMVARAFNSSSKNGEVIVVPFGGSGPDFIVAEQLNRKCYGMEISPQYCDVIIQRWEKLTSKKATLESK